MIVYGTKDHLQVAVQSAHIAAAIFKCNKSMVVKIVNLFYVESLIRVTDGREGPNGSDDSQCDLARKQPAANSRRG